MFQQELGEERFKKLVAWVSTVYSRFGFDPSPQRDEVFAILEASYGRDPLLRARWLVLEARRGLDDDLEDTGDRPTGPLAFLTPSTDWPEGF